MAEKKCCFFSNRSTPSNTYCCTIWHFPEHCDWDILVQIMSRSNQDTYRIHVITPHSIRVLNWLRTFSWNVPGMFWNVPRGDRPMSCRAYNIVNLFMLRNLIVKLFSVLWSRSALHGDYCVIFLRFIFEYVFVSLLCIVDVRAYWWNAGFVTQPFSDCRARNVLIWLAWVFALPFLMILCAGTSVPRSVH